MVAVVTRAAAAVAPAVKGGTSRRKIGELNAILRSRMIGVNLRGCAVRARDLTTHCCRRYAPVGVVEGFAAAGRTNERGEGNVGGEHTGRAMMMMNVSEMRAMQMTSAKTAASCASTASGATATMRGEHTSHEEDLGASELGVGILIAGAFPAGTRGWGGHCAVRILRGTQLTKVAHREEHGGSIGVSGKRAEELTELGLRAQGDLIAVCVDVR